MKNSLKEKLEEVIKDEEFRTRLSSIEDKILQRGLMTDIVPLDFYDVALVPKVYFNEFYEDYRIKIIIDIGTEEDGASVSEDEMEVISDFVSDYLNDRGFYQYVDKFFEGPEFIKGVEDASLFIDWFPVKFGQ